MMIDLDAPRLEQIDAALASLVVQTKRCQHITHLLSTEQPTEWDRRHADIDALLDRREELTK